MKTPKIEDITITTDEDAELADYVVCCRVGTQSPFTDNLYGECSECGHQVFFRPHAPKRPKRLCMECAEVKFEETDEVFSVTTIAQQEALKKLREH